MSFYITDAVNSVVLYPELDFERQDPLVLSDDRSAEGSLFQYIWGQQNRVDLKARFVSSADALQINSWWGAKINVSWGFVNYPGSVSSGYILGKTKPCGSYISPSREFNIADLILGGVSMPKAAQAATVSLTGLIFSTGDGNTCDYIYFTLAADADVTITVESSSFDTYIYLFNDDGALDSSDYIDKNDDYQYPTSTNSQIVAALTAGDYIIATASWPFSLTEALNGDTNNDPLLGDSYDLTIEGGNISVVYKDTASGRVVIA